MDKYTEVFRAQNPNTTFSCGNLDCRKESAFKTKDVFKNKSFVFRCDSCGKITEIDAAKLAKDIATQLKKLGVTAR